jgi:hypothetical protein
MLVFGIKSDLRQPRGQQLDDDVANAAVLNSNATIGTTLFNLGPNLKDTLIDFAERAVGQCVRSLRRLLLRTEDGLGPLKDALIFCMHDHAAQYLASRNFASDALG